MAKIRDVKPGETAVIADGPAKGREVRVFLRGASVVIVRDPVTGEPQVVRGDLEVE